MDNNKSTKIEKKILDAINSGQIKMRPKWHFVLQTGLFISGTILVSLLILFITSFIIFSLHRNGVWFVPIFGLRGLQVFMMSLPWILIFVALSFILILEILFRKFSFGYRRPLLYTALSIIIISAIGGFAVSKTPLHRNISEGLYKNFGERHFDNIHPCMITSSTTEGFNCVDFRNKSLFVIITPSTKFPLGTDFAPGDNVVILGPEEDEKITAIGIREVNEFIPYPTTTPAGPPFRMILR